MCRQGMRVDVWDGSGTNYLGQGEMLGFVKVYVVRDSNGLLSLTDAEQNPEGIIDGLVEEVPSNPKIKLDSGKIVYGCQTWWHKVGALPQKSDLPQKSGFCLKSQSIGGKK